MNKQEVVELLRDVAQRAFYRTGRRSVHIDDIVEIVNRIDEPQKVVVPKYVAEWIEKYKNKKKKYRLAHALEHVFNDAEVSFYIKQQEGDYTETIAKAWIYGYTVEKEKLYTVEIPNNGGTLVLAYINNAIKLVDGNKHLHGKFTKESIESAGFGWLFDCNGAKVVEEENE